MRSVQGGGIRIQPGARDATHTLAAYVAAYALPLVSSCQRVGVLCVGTDRSTGDALGPITGTLLAETGSDVMDVWGTLDDPVHAVNLDAWARSRPGPGVTSAQPVPFG